MASTILGENALTLPVGTTAQRPETPTAGMIRKNSSTGYIEYYDTVTSSWVGVGEFFAQGGTEETNTDETGTYKVHYWTGSGGTLNVFQGTIQADFTMNAGGGAGSKAHSQNVCGGGGAGGIISSLSTDCRVGTSPQPKITLTPGTYSIVIGGGGTCDPSSGNRQGTNGSNTTAFGYTAVGGGAGGFVDPGTGGSGGSGGGAGSYSGSNTLTYNGGSGTTGQGNAGGNFTTTSGQGGGGGGSPVAAGQTAPGLNGGNGGAAVSSKIRIQFDGIARSGGGGASGWDNAAGGVGGTALSTTDPISGGTGGTNTVNATNGQRGGGGGAAKSGTIAGNGAGGIVIIRYKIG